MTDQTLLILCANLARRKDRKFALERGFGSVLGEKIQFLTAVDGSRISGYRIERYPKGVSPSNFAVRLSKRIALRNFLKTNRSHLLFLEDDVAFSEEFEDTLQRGMDRNTDLIFLGTARELIKTSVVVGGMTFIVPFRENCLSFQWKAVGQGAGLFDTSLKFLI
jgi:GR25 family glycosyltransferase involved in LPS biosynthesis